MCTPAGLRDHADSRPGGGGRLPYFSLGVDLTPKVDVPTVSITVVNPGATAEEIETDITKRIEDAVNTISDIDDVRSTSVQGAFHGDRQLFAR